MEKSRERERERERERDRERGRGREGESVGWVGVPGQDRDRALCFWRGAAD